MRRSTLATALVAVFISYLGTPAAVKTGGYVPTDLVTNRSFTDKNGIPHTGQIQDANLLNPWGVTEIPTGMGSPFWISDNAAGVATLYNVPHDAPNTVTKNPRVVSIPTPGHPVDSSGAPTGTVFNITTLPGSTPGFMISGVEGDGMTKITAPARFLFATEDGTIVGWNPDVFPPGQTGSNPPGSNFGIIALNNSGNNFDPNATASIRDSPSPRMKMA